MTYLSILALGLLICLVSCNLTEAEKETMEKIASDTTQVIIQDLPQSPTGTVKK